MSIDPRNCRTGNPDNGGNCTACEEYRRLRAASAARAALWFQQRVEVQR